jgi:hypothetical protein
LGFFRWMLPGLVLATVIGCGGGPSLPGRAKVTGKVTLDGKPLARGTVTFAPDNARGTTGPAAVGQIGADGKYELTTDRSGRGGDGAVIGFHRISVQSREDVEAGQLAKSLIPAAYEDPDRSGLTAEVKAGQANEVNLELHSGAK